MTSKAEHPDFYHPIEILPTRGRRLLNIVRSAVLFSHRTVGRKMGLWRIVNFLSPFFRNWAECPVVGPDSKPLLVDLRGQGFGIVTQGYGVSEITPLIACLAENAVVLDVGANIGVWSRLFADRVRRGTVYAFEPSPSTFSLLSKNVSGHSNIVCVQMALGGESGTAGFREDTEPVLRHLAPSANGAGAIQIRIGKLDDWVKEVRLARLDFMKLDIEGFEEELLSGAFESLERFRPTILFEFLPGMAEMRSKFKGRMIFGMLRNRGYRIYRLDKSGFLHEDFVIPEDWTNDYLAIEPNSELRAEVAKLIVQQDGTTGGLHT